MVLEQLNNVTNLFAKIKRYYDINQSNNFLKPNDDY